MKLNFFLSLSFRILLFSNQELDESIVISSQKAANLKDRKDSKEKMYDEKLVAIDSALKKIEEISQASQS